LVGSWRGDWGMSAAERTRLLLTLEFGVDQVIAGAIFENGQRIPLTSAMLDPDTWTVTLTAERVDGDRTIRYLIEGRIENLGSTTERAIAGRWTEGDMQGEFRVVLN
jgi:hypothetical protein